MQRESVESKSDFNADLNCYWLSIFGRGLEAPILDGLDGFLVQTHAQTSLHVNVVGSAVGADDHCQYTGAFIASLPGLFGVHRIGRGNGSWGQNTAAHAEDASANPATPTFPDARAGAFADTATGPGADPRSAARSIRKRGAWHGGCRGISEVRQFHGCHLNFGRSDHGWLHSELGVLVANDDRGRSDLREAKFGQPSLRCRKLVEVTTSTSAGCFLPCWRQHVGVRGWGDEGYVVERGPGNLGLLYAQRRDHEHNRDRNQVQGE